SATPSAASLVWTPVGAGDFNGDDKPDVLWHNTSTGQLSIWLMNGTARASAVVPGGAGLDWTPVAAGDFNTDGKQDILWHNTKTGKVSVRLMNGTHFTSAVTPGRMAAAPPEW